MSEMSIHVALPSRHPLPLRPARDAVPAGLRLRPAPHCRTPVLSYALSVEPGGHFINWQQDPFANYLARLVFPDKTTEFKVTVDLVAEMSVYNPFDFFLEPDAESFPFDYEGAVSVKTAGLKHDLLPYLAKLPLTPRWRQFVASVDTRAQRTIDFLVAINQRLQREISYVIRMEPGVQTPEQTLTLGKGSCRDTGWLLVQTLRHLGLAARFVSGYLIQLTPDVKSLDGPAAPSATSPTCMRGARSIWPGAGWSGSTRPPACSPARATSRLHARPIRHRRRRSPVRWTSARCSSVTRCACSASTRRRG